MAKRRKQKRTKPFNFNKLFFIINIVVFVALALLFYQTAKNDHKNSNLWKKNDALWSDQVIIDYYVHIPTDSGIQQSNVVPDDSTNDSTEIPAG